MRNFFHLWLFAVLLAVSGCGLCAQAQAEDPERAGEAVISGDRDGAGGQEESAPWDIAQELESYLDLGEIEEGFRSLSEQTEFSFSETVLGLLRGEIPFEPERIWEAVLELFLGQLRRQRQMALQILVIVLASAIFSNFVKVFDSSQIADISFFMMYLLISTLLMKAFLDMNQDVVRTCSAMNRFMKLLLPSYLATVVLSAGTVSAVGFYEITVLGMQLLQSLMLRAVLPAINFYLIMLLLNQMSAEDHFSRFAELMETVIQWVTKSVFGIVVGLQTVQMLVAPAVDSLKNSALHRLARALPGVGTVLDSAAETVAGSAVVIKNAVGVAGILALAVLCLAPLLRLLACILMFRLLCALIQPFSEKRLVEGISSISRGAALLLRILATGMSVFMISLAMVTAAVRGG